MSFDEAAVRLRLGKAVEQWIGTAVHGDATILRWTRVDRRGGSYATTLFEAIESERAEYDIYGLYAAEPDEDGDPQEVFGAGSEQIFPDAEAALRHAADISGMLGGFVADGLVQDEYREARKGT